jgi:hypothetical protein
MASLIPKPKTALTSTTSVGVTHSQPRRSGSQSLNILHFEIFAGEKVFFFLILFYEIELNVYECFDCCRENLNNY